MKVPLTWLQEMCPVELSAEELAELLTANGVHVEGIARPWAGLAGVLVARVLQVEDHPASDRLCVARVSTGVGEHTLVVGVRNMAPGDLVPYAGPGATVPGLPQPLREREIRGVVSEGMLCSPRELGISPDHEAILVLPPDSPLGADVKLAFGLDEAVLDVEVEPNRPDLMSVLGVAREAAAATELPLEHPDTTVVEDDEKADQAATVKIDDLERCPRYLARIVRDVAIGPSPLRVQARLTACGMRPLSNVVDATNYVMLEVGQPLHPFDLDLLAGPGIVVRRAGEGERLTTLDDVERMLTADDLVIADLERSVAIAGVIGSSVAEVSAASRHVLLESANFERTGIIRTARRLKLSTEASSRFERGVDPEAVPAAAARAAALMAAWSGGRVLAGSIDVGDEPPRRRVVVRPSRASLLIGDPVIDRDLREAFGRLRIEAWGEEGGDEVVVEVPGHRVDLEQEVDLIEEVARIRGYERTPSRLPPVRQAGGEQPSYAFRRSLRRIMVRAGLRETRSLSFASAADLELTGDRDAIRVANPLVADDAFLRTSLLPGLLRALARNAARQVRTAVLFEIGQVFFPGDAEPVEERERLAFVMTGPAGSWPEQPRQLDVLDAKGVVEALTEGLGIEALEFGGAPSRRLFHPTRSASVYAGGELLGEFGEVAPRLARLFDLPERAAVGEFDTRALGRHTGGVIVVEDVPRFPPVRRDLAFLVAPDVPAGRVREAILEAARGLAGSAILFDVFTGPPLPEGRKNLAFSVDFRAPDRTLTDEEVEVAVRAVAARLREQFGAELRAG